ncbi:MAG: hypothetical protein KKF67_02495 [Nanoarchaeota archaeon]|nr:hypothetical protein [Nanoarchaeota archaeon]
MLIKLLGVVDLFAGIFLLLGMFFKPFTPLLILGIILLLKSTLGMLKDFASWIDFLSGFTLLLLITLNIPKFILIGLGVLLIQKAAFSFTGD